MFFSFFSKCYRNNNFITLRVVTIVVGMAVVVTASAVGEVWRVVTAIGTVVAVAIVGGSAPLLYRRVYLLSSKTNFLAS